MSTNIISDIKECERLWKLWNKGKGIFDRWDVRMCFYDPDKMTPHFISSPGFLIPLWYLKEEECYEFFGGDLHEGNRIFLAQGAPMKDALDSLPGWSFLFYIAKDQEQGNLLTVMREYDKFILDCSKLGSWQGYLRTFSSKHKKNMLSDLGKISANVIIHLDDIDHAPFAIEFNKERFGKESSFHDSGQEQGFLKLLGLCKKNHWLSMYSLEQDGKIVGVQPAIFYDGVYTVLSGGSDIDVKNAGKLLIALHMQRAFKLGARIIDFLSHDAGWKTLWNLTPVEQLEYEKEGEE